MINDRLNNLAILHLDLDICVTTQIQYDKIKQVSMGKNLGVNIIMLCYKIMLFVQHVWSDCQ